jgi:hypothetical protein
MFSDHGFVIGVSVQTQRYRKSVVQCLARPAEARTVVIYVTPASSQAG